MLYIMDAESEKLVLKPKGMGERSAGHMNLKDFYYANKIHTSPVLEIPSVFPFKTRDIFTIVRFFS